MKNVMTIDVEDYFHVTAFAGTVKPADWPSYHLRVVESTQRILDCLAVADTQATFFVLGWVADRCPALVRRIAAAGHEVASHGYWHQLVDTQSPKEFRNDVRLGKLAVENALGGSVTAYRAPSFSITPTCLWAFDILVDEGFRVDSSAGPGRGQRSTTGGDGQPFIIETKSGPLVEAPVSAVSMLGRRVPVGGGGYFRLAPYQFTSWAIRTLNKNGAAAVVYLHPWEFDPGQPVLPGSAWNRWKHRVNLGSTEAKFVRLLADFEFQTLRASLSMIAVQRAA